MIKQVLLGGATLFLLGCQSEFDRCMDTELPRAESLAGIEAERAAGRQLVSMREQNGKFDNVDNAMTEWHQKNPESHTLKYPKYKCSDTSGTAFKDCSDTHDKLVEQYKADVEVWMATPEGKSWVALRDEEYKRLGHENGLAITDQASYEVLVDEVWNAFDTILKPRSPIYQCLNDYKCDEYEWSDENVLDSLKKSFDEAILNNASEISALVVTTKELATVTCNNNGFYE